MFKKNNLWLGAFSGIILPVITWLIFTVWMPGKVILNKPVLPYFIALFMNLILIRYFHRNSAENTARGVMLVTFVFVVLIFLFKFRV